MERIVKAISLLAAGSVGQTALALVPAPTGTATTGQVKDYSLNGVYSTDGTTIKFITSMTFPIE